MTQQDFEYREKHAVVPQLDYLNGGLSNIIAPPIKYSQYAHLGTITKVNGGKVASGVFGALEGALHMASGNFGYGLGKTIASTAKTATGVVDPAYLETQKIICSTIKEWEEISWKERFFIKNFVPAEGNPGDIVCEHDEFDEFYCGNGRKYLYNGDYFEGLFVDGKMSWGIYIFASGSRYLGNFDEDYYIVGRGMRMYESGNTYYYGESSQSMRNGVGAMWYTNGVYVGHWADDMRQGHGFLRVDDKFYDGQFNNDELVK